MHDLLPPKTGIETTLVDITDLAAVEAAITERTRVIFTESIANPTLRVADIPRLSEIARRHGIKLVVDNTFSPLILSPKALGADIVVHSMTKFINGASDYIAGAVCADQEFIQELMDLHTGAVCADQEFIQELMDLHTGMLMILGPTMDPQVAFNISLRIPHLPLRMKEHSMRAQVFAERLQARGLAVTYPGLPVHPDHDLLSALRCAEYGYGGILTLDVGTETLAYELLDLLQNKHHFGYVAVSLGYFDTLMSCSGSSTSSEMTSEDKSAAGISPGLVRMSLGITGTLEQRWQQLESALHQTGILAVSDRVQPETRLVAG
jgi:methionine-gamma-lyase